MRFFFFSCIFIISSSAFAQQDSVSINIDDNYREDQFYLGLTYNIFDNKPEGLFQSGFSGGLHLGFIRDFPFNERRNLALGIGLGVSFNVYNHNLFIGENIHNETIFRLLDRSEIDYDSNRFNTYLIEVPIEFRWRTSTPAEYKFWRVYTGLKMGYLYYFKSKLIQPHRTIKQTSVDELNRLRFGATLSVGRGNINFHIYYSLNPLFNGSLLNEKEIGINPIKVGLMFYIL